MAARVVDYSPLLSTPTPQDVSAYRAEVKARTPEAPGRAALQIVLIVMVALISLGVLIPAIGGITIAIISDVQHGNPMAAIVLGMFLLASVVIGGALIRAAVAGSGRWGRWLKMDRFARANGFVFAPSSPSPTYAGAIFQRGHSRRATEHFRTADGRFLDFGNFTYTTGSGKNARTYNWGFLALHLDRKLPHMVLDARANNGLFGGSNLPATFTKDQVLSLEGDFDRYFTLYCPKQYERDALYVFTPDLMALLIDEASPYDVEIIDDWMFVYSGKPFPPGVPAVYERLLRIVDTVGAKTLTQTDRYHDDRTALPFAANVVAPEGTRLKRGVGAGAIILIVVAALMWGWSFFADVLSRFIGG